MSLLFAGCATGTKQFEPTPRASVGTAELEPVQPRSVTELLRDAEKAFHEANAAQERGDNEAALRQYTLMLELLIEADLDPGVFYSLRGEFEEVLNTSTTQASLYEQRRRHRNNIDQYAPLQGASEIQIPFPLPERVIAEIEEIQTGYPKNFQAGLDRAQKYLPYVREEFRKAGLPEDLAWVAMVESLFTPKIVSRAGAGGMWQFMKTTAKRYNLRLDGHVDERYNWQSSTRAAIAYLRDLYDYFGGDWGLAITAYNWGEGSVERAIADNGGDRDLWKLYETPPASNRIPMEAKKYFPRFVATLIVASNPERYGFKLNPATPENSVRIPVKGMYALADLNKAMSLPAGTLEYLNPDLIQRVTPPSGEYAVAVPVEQRQTFLASLQSTKTVQHAPSTGSSHTVRRGETVASIAKKYGISPETLMRANNIRSARRLMVGQRLKLPGDVQPDEAPAPEEDAQLARGGAPGDAPAPEESKKAEEAPEETGKKQAEPGKSYRVRPGDTLYDIAKANNVSVPDLQKWNQLDRNSRIQAGRTLFVSAPGEAEEAAEPKAETQTASAKSEPKKAQDTEEAESGQFHTVKAGEYPALIARAYGIPVDELLRLNDMSPSSTIRVGDRLRVGGKAPQSEEKTTAKKEEEEEKPAQETTHKIAKGETLSEIAEKYHVSTKDLMAWNKLTARSVLRTGDSLVIRGSGAAKSENTQVARAESDADGEKIVHVVARGHNPSTIAHRYGVSISDLYRWNDWSKNHVLRVGDKVVIYKQKG